MEEKRVSQDTAKNEDWRDDHGVPRRRCWTCGELGADGACGLTGEDILFPASGPVGFRCPLPKWHDAEAGGQVDGGTWQENDAEER